MQVYFVKATYTNNVYKLSDFFLNGDYKKDANKMLDLNFIANDDETFIKGTRQLTLPDDTSIREYTHIIVPDYNKIYRITDIVYLNVSQANINLQEDPTIGNYLELEDKDIILRRTNDTSLFRGVNDIADLALKETVVTDVISPDIKSGKWALLFFQVDTGGSPVNIGLDFAATGPDVADYRSNTISELTTDYPEVQTNDPEIYPYYGRIAYNLGDTTLYQCVYRHTAFSGQGGIEWVLYQGPTILTYYIDVGLSAGIPSSKIAETDVFTHIIALPFDTTLYNTGEAKHYLSYSNFIGPTTEKLIDIKIVNDLFIEQDSVSENWVLPTRQLRKDITFATEAVFGAFTYSDLAATTKADKVALVLLNSINDLDISYNQGTITPTNAEPFKKYQLYVFGQKFSIPYYLTDGIRLLISINTGVINYLVYYQNVRNIIASGSFTHSIKYQIDKLDSFYSQNPTYKDQFYLKMGGNAFKTVAGGISGGMATGGPMGALVGGAGGAFSAAVDAGLGVANLGYMEKGLMMKPDEMYGENSEVSLQVLSVFGVYWVIKTPENADLLQQEYSLRGFPTALIKSISDLSYATSNIFGTSKVVFGELKEVVRNEYATNKINEKLQQGIILVP